MCECIKISYTKCDNVCEYSYEKCENHDWCYFDANINLDMCMKVMLLMDMYMYLVCVLSRYLFNFIMRIADDVIGNVYDDVDASAYEYVNVCADDNGYDIYICTCWKMRNEFRDCKSISKMKIKNWD